MLYCVNNMVFELHVCLDLQWNELVLQLLT